MNFRIKSLAAVLAAALVGANMTLPAAASDNLPDKGDKLNGFIVTGTQEFEPLGAELISFEHIKTGAKVIYCANDDTNRLFQISFITPAEDNSGITHIFEHSTLGGSKKYPSSTLFMKLTNQTYNTYMNAVTGQNVTSFPLASLSEKQLLSLSDYYLDSVFNPMIYTDESIFDREAWRYELTSGGDDLTVSGTVYSEMLGASNISRDNIYNVRGALFPDSYSMNDPGGVPEDMLSLSNGDLIEYHKKYYVPSNSMTILYGDIECGDFLELLDSYFSKYTKISVNADLESYSPTADFVERSCDYPVQSASSGRLNSCVSYAIECKNADYDADNLAKLSMAVNIWAGTVENTAQKLMPEILLSCALDTDAPEPVIIFTAVSPDSDIGDEFKNIVDASAQQLITGGIDEDLLKSISLSTRRAQAASVDSTFGESSILAASMWAVTGNPLYAFDYIDSTYELDDVTSRDLTDVLKKYISGSRTAIVSTVPAAGLADAKAAEMSKRLSDTKNAMSDEEQDAIVERTIEYHDNTDTNEELDRKLLSEISVVDAQTLPEEVREYDITDETIDGVRYVSASADIGEIGRGCVMLDVSDIPAEELNWLALYCSLIGAAGTEKYSQNKFQTIAGQYADCTVNIITFYDDSENGFIPYLVFEYEGFSDDSEMIFDIAEQALLKPDLSDTASISALADQYRSSLSDAVDSNGFNMLQKHVLASCEPWQAYYNAMGTSLDSDIENSISLIETDIGAAVEKLKEIQNRLNNKRGAAVIYVGSEESIAKNKAAAEKFFAKLPDDPKQTADYTPLMTDYESSALVINSNVNYNGLYAPVYELGLNYSGDMEVAVKCITDKLLLPVIRDKFNAYGAECEFTDDGLLVYSYSDPEIANTFKIYSQLSDMIKNADITQEDVDRYILSVYSGFVEPEGELSGAYWAASDYMEGVTSEIKLRQIRGIKSATPETVKQMADTFEKLFENGVAFTAGSAAAVTANSGLYNSIINPLGYDLGGIKIIVNGSTIQTTVPAYIENDRVMIPMRSIFEALGASVEWNEETREVTAKKDGVTIVLTIDADTIKIIDQAGNTAEAVLDSPAVIRDDYTMVPLRAVSETFGYDVDWNGDTQTVYIG